MEGDGGGMLISTERVSGSIAPTETRLYSSYICPKSVRF